MVCFECKCQIGVDRVLGGSVLVDWLGGIAPVCLECV